MAESNSTKRATRPIGNVRIQADGSIVAESTLSPESFVVGAEIWIPPRKVIPIVFLPGIMGSNLKVKKGAEGTVRKRMGARSNEPIPAPWRPPNGKWDGWNESNAWSELTPKTRQALLSGDTTTVDDSGFLKTSKAGLLLSNLTSKNDEEARFRGWGTMHWDSYGDFLLYLEKELRGLHDPNLESKCEEWRVLLHAGDSKKSKVPAAFKVAQEDLQAMSKYWFPVYACGYNWINCNAESGEHLLDTIEKIIDVYAGMKGPSGKPLFRCEQVILVTHSMGGLVGRWAAKYDTKKRILGVIHGVQPAIGAPLAYRRMAGGTESSSPTNGRRDNLKPGALATIAHTKAMQAVLREIDNLKSDAFASIAGQTSAETTPVMGNSPGALQLLPTKRYPKGWLKAEREGTGGQTAPLFSLPEQDPYQEIYREKKAWWGLVNPRLLDPAEVYVSVQKDPWEKGFLKSLDKAERFHDTLGDFYHSRTYVSYGDDPSHASFGTVRWRIGQDTNHLSASEIQAADRHDFLGLQAGMTEFTVDRLTDSPLPLPNGKKRVGTRWIVSASLQPQDAPGDGTVPWQSGEAPGRASAQGRTFALRGYDHQGSYEHEGTRRFTLWAIAQLVKAAV